VSFLGDADITFGVPTILWFAVQLLSSEFIMSSLPSRPAEEKPLQRADEVNDVRTASRAVKRQL
jgi:hypothetical protein